MIASTVTAGLATLRATATVCVTATSPATAAAGVAVDFAGPSSVPPPAGATPVADGALRIAVTGLDAAACGLSAFVEGRDPGRGADGPAAECRAARADPACADRPAADCAESESELSAWATPPAIKAEPIPNATASAPMRPTA
ncbi:hypothetical protein [Mycobacterium sp. EPa45]|uniref:hypothetical protein n=1 Tax=Mycobacterium sp. EPa45 TaxID=1545728 RepID=UPI00130EB3AD|nr:hypothetical protein [Mycobacterium sp. EPa45]